MQQIVNVVTPAETASLLTIEELKTMLTIAIDDVSQDDQLELLIEISSGEIARLLNRTLGYEGMVETFTDVSGARRLYLSHWPVALDDITEITTDGVSTLADTDWKLEEETGTLYKTTNSWNGEIVVTYSGGYNLPEEAPNALKQAAILMGRDAYYQAIRGDSSVRMIAHKESRVMYFSPDQMTVSTATGGGISASRAAIDSLLSHYRRINV